MKNEKTTWTSPKTNIFSGMNDLRKCLSSGYNCRLVKEYNENCKFPIIETRRIDIENPDNWKSSNSTLWTLEGIKNSKNLSDDQKHMMINYCTVFGTDQAIKKYRNTGKLTKDNIKGMGRPCIVKRKDVIDFLIKNNEEARSECFDLTNGEKHFVENYHLKPEYNRIPKKFKSKLWVVELLSKDEPKQKTPFLAKLITIVAYPLKWIPKKSVLRMDDYKLITYRLGDVTNGFSVEFHIPKKFSF